MSMGDIPYSQALDIEEYRCPVYDSQKDVFIGVLSDLEKADEFFATANTFEGDPFYKGDPVKWRKATNVLRLKVLISLSKRVDDTPELNIKETFARIVAEGNLFQSNDDNLQVVYSDKQGQQNPFHNSFVKSINEYAGSALLIDPLKKFENYLKGPYVAYNTKGTQTERLKQIWIQVYIARYYHMQYDDYYDYRRNTYPEFPINPNTNLNDDKTKIPMRWQYPDPVLYPGFTFPAGNKLAEEAKLEKLAWAPDVDERDRIDFIYYYPTNASVSLEKCILVGPSETVIRGKIEESDSWDKFFTPKGIWPTDYKGNLATFKVASGK